MNITAIAQWLKRRTRDQKVAGSSPARAAGEFSSPMPAFLCCYVGIRSTSVLQQQHVNDPGHSAKSADGRLQLNTYAPYIRGFE